MSSAHKKDSNSDQLIMTIEKGVRPTSPVHVHVNEKTPVHVHVKKPKKAASIKSLDAKLTEAKTAVKTAANYGASNLRRSTATAHARSKSPNRGPWVPPPGKTTSGSKYSWQGPQHRLEISGPQDIDGMQSSLHLTDLHVHGHDVSTDEEDRVHGKMRNYEKKIDSLMSEVGALKNEVHLQRSMREVEKREEMLESSRRVLEEQEVELQDYQRELEATETENRILRHSMDRLRDEADLSKNERDRLSSEREKLMKKLVEVEMDGQAAGKQVAALRDSIRRLREEKRMSSADSAMLSKQKELLMERLSDFEATNRTLRKMLRDRHEQEAASLRLSEQRDILLKKLSETEGNLQKMKLDKLDGDRQIVDLRMALNAQKDENLSISGLQKSLESTRGHLQKQLRQKESDCNRMAVQIRTLESQLAQEKIDVDHLQELLGQAKEKSDHDKEALKKATRVQKQRASRSEDAVEQLNAQLMERDTLMAELRTDLDNFRSRYDKLNKEKAQVQAENSALKTRIAELEGIMERVEDASKSQVESATARLHEKTNEASSLKLENDRMKTSIATIEDKLAQAEQEVGQLRSNLRQYETLVEEYRSQSHNFLSRSEMLGSSSRPRINRSRRDADDTIVQLEEQKRETSRIQREGDFELDKVKNRLQTRLQELEPIPELLKTTELRLQDCNEKLVLFEKRHVDNTKLIAELTAKVEHQNDHLDSMREKYRGGQDEVRSVHAKLESMDRKLHDIEEQNRELLTNVAKREEALHQTNMHLEEKTRENASLTRQLETALADARRQAEQAKDKAASKDRTSQTRLLELESQLSSARAEIARIKREKDEAERKFNSRLYDLKDRLEQSHSTNRSMQNYVQFLKSSYANVFGDSSVAPPASSPLRGTFH